MECLPQSTCIAIAVSDFPPPECRVLLFIQRLHLAQLCRPCSVVDVRESALEPSFSCSHLLVHGGELHESVSNHGVVFLLALCCTVTVGQCWSSTAVSGINVYRILGEGGGEEQKICDLHRSCITDKNYFFSFCYFIFHAFLFIQDTKRSKHCETVSIIIISHSLI